MSGAIDLSLIGTSDFPAFVPGASKFADKSKLWLRIVRGVELPMEDWLRKAARSGQLDERATARMLLEEFFGVPAAESDARLLKIEQRKDVPGRPWQRYHGGDFEGSLDGQTLLIECKSRSRWGLEKGDWGADGSDQVDAAVFAQVQGQLEAIRHDRDNWVGSDLPDLDVVHVAVRVDGRDIRHFCVERDEEVGGLLVEAAERFWLDHVVPEVPPPVDGSEGADRELEVRFAKYSQEIREPNATELGLLRQLRAVHKTIAEIEAELEDFKKSQRVLEQHLKGLIGNDLGLEIPDDVRAVWRDVKGRLKWRGLIDELAGRLGLTKAQLTELEDAHRGATRRALAVQFKD